MEQQMIDSTVLELMASRICHDLISPVGAVNNGVEFLQDDMGGDVSDAVSLIAMSAESAAARLQVLRLAYGTGGRDATIKPAMVRETFDAFLAAEGKTKQVWDAHAVFADYDRPEGFCKLLMCGLMLGHESLPKGGTIDVTLDDGVIFITCAGQDAGVRPTVEQALARTLDVSVVDPRLVHPYITAILAAQYGHGLSVSGKDDGVVTFRLARV